MNEYSPLLPPLELDLDVDVVGEVESHERIDGLRRRIDDVDQTLVRAHFEMLTAVLVLVWRTDDAVHALLRRQRHGAHNSRTSASDGVHDLACGTVTHSVVVRVGPAADLRSRPAVVAFYRCLRPSAGSALGPAVVCAGCPCPPPEVGRVGCSCRSSSHFSQECRRRFYAVA